MLGVSRLTQIPSKGIAPSEFIRFFPVLDPCDLVIKSLRKRTDFIVTDDDFLSLVIDLTNRGDDGCCPTPKDLL